jgi:hypothetical protein
VAWSDCRHFRHDDCGAGHIPLNVGAALMDVDDVVAPEKIAEVDARFRFRAAPLDDVRKSICGYRVHVCAVLTAGHRDDDLDTRRICTLSGAHRLAFTVWATHYPPDANLFNYPLTESPAWKTKPSWSSVAKRDRTVHPDPERYLAKRMGATTTELDSSRTQCCRSRVPSSTKTA